MQFYRAAIVVTLVVVASLVGYRVFSAANKGSVAVLVSMAGNPVITADEFKSSFNDFVEKNGLQSIVEFMSDAEKKYLEGLVSQKVVDRFIQEKGIDRLPEYQEELKKLGDAKNARQALHTKYFVQNFPVEVTEVEAKAFYDKNKDRLLEVIISKRNEEKPA